MWKLMTGVFAEEMYDHLETNKLLPEERKVTGEKVGVLKTSF